VSATANIARPCSLHHRTATLPPFLLDRRLPTQGGAQLVAHGQEGRIELGDLVYPRIGQRDVEIAGCDLPRGAAGGRQRHDQGPAKKPGDRAECQQQRPEPHDRQKPEAAARADPVSSPSRLSSLPSSS
jgi:hypothetical protein